VDRLSEPVDGLSDPVGHDRSGAHPRHDAEGTIMAARKKNGGTAAGSAETPIEALLHKDTRKNIPTRESRNWP